MSSPPTNSRYVHQQCQSGPRCSLAPRSLIAARAPRPPLSCSSLHHFDRPRQPTTESPLPRDIGCVVSDREVAQHLPDNAHHFDARRVGTVRYGVAFYLRATAERTRERRIDATDCLADPRQYPGSDADRSQCCLVGEEDADDGGNDDDVIFRARPPSR